MQKFIKYILIWTLAGIFLVSFTGLRLLIHECIACESSGVYLFSQINDCCDHNNENQSSDSTCKLPVNETSSCCSVNDTESQCENCCKNEPVYVKNEYDVSPSRQHIKIHPVEFEVASIALHDLYGFNSREYKFLYRNIFIPPPKLVGKDFILYSHQLKTDCISFQA